MLKLRKKCNVADEGDEQPAEVPMETDDKKQSEIRIEQSADVPMETDDNMNESVIYEEKHYSDEEGSLRIGDIYIPPPPQPTCTNGNARSRLLITYIEIENFKSYAGKHLLGPFHKSFTSIVGPNGSGKSNILDSMLFVFGSRASKIRSKKISAFLHKSADHQNVQSCKVAVHFKEITDIPGTDGFKSVPNSEIVLSRTAFKDNSSFYSVNGHHVQFKELRSLLRNLGIDLGHNRFLILQGEVDQIATMKPKARNEYESGLLEFLEDVIGTSRYKEPFEKLTALVEKLNEERSEKLNRVKLAEKEMESIRKVLLPHLRLENKYNKLKHMQLQTYIYESELHAMELEKQKREIVDGNKQIWGKLPETQRMKEEMSKEIKECSKVIEELMSKKEKLSEDIKQINQHHYRVKADFTLTNKKRMKLKELLTDEEKKLSELQHVPEKNEKEIAELTARDEKFSKDLEKEKAAMDKAIAGLKIETQELQDRKDRFQTKLIGLTKTVNETRSAHEVANKQLDLYVSKEQDEKNKLQQIRKNYETAKITVDGRKDEITALKEGLSNTERELQEAQSELAKVLDEETRILSEMKKYRAQVEETKSSMQATHSHENHVLNLLMEQNIGTIFGRLGDLGVIDPKYDVAVSTACGPLDNIVVDTVYTGQRCIEILKRNNIGRHTFIALEKQEHLRSIYSAGINPPEGVPRLFDLIRVDDDRLRPAFYYALRDTLVAKNLDQASRIAYGATRYRVVTLDGTLIEISGAMSGGGNTVLRGRMGQSVAAISTGTTSKKIEVMEHKLQEMMEYHARQIRTQGSLEDKVSLLTQRRRTMKMDLDKYEMEIKILAEQIPDLEQQLRRQQEKVRAAAPDPAQLKRMTEYVAKLKAEYDRADEEAGKVAVEVQKLNEQIIKIPAGRIKAAQKKVDEANNDLDKVRKEISRLKIAIKTSEMNCKRSSAKINIEQEFEECENKIRAMEKEMETLQTEEQLNVGELKAVSDSLVFNEEAQEILKVELAELEKEENKLKAKKLEVYQKIKNVDKEIHVFSEKGDKLIQELNRLKMHEIQGEEVPDLRMMTLEEVQKVNIKEIQRKMNVTESQLKKREPKFSVTKEYQQKETMYLELVAELEKSTEKRNMMRKHYQTARMNRLNEFMKGLYIISFKLKEIYQTITSSGDAELEPVDSFDPFSEGINFSVRPPRKTWMTISHLSGGEKTISSLALYFALLTYRPTPLYVMDEIDTALDSINVITVARFIKKRTKNAQFIIVSHHSNMFELADRLVGIYKTQNYTHSVTINPKLYATSPMSTAAFKVPQTPAKRDTSAPKEELKRKIRREEPPVSNCQMIYQLVESCCSETHIM